jgi:hypothetical protein
MLFTASTTMLRHFFSYVPSDPPPDEPETEPADPNTDRNLSDSLRAARRTLVAVCAVSLAWSTAQFGPGNVTFNAGGVTVDLQSASIPLLLGAGMLYLAGRWMLEFAMMPRHVRRWPLAQLDFRVVSFVTRFSMLALAAAALQRSLWSVVIVVLSLVAIAVVSGLLSFLLIFVTMPIRMWARRRANAVSAASASGEAFIWAVLFAVFLTVVGNPVLAIASYRYEPLRMWLWPVPPDAVAMTVFILTLNAVFLSHWLLIPIVRKLFAERPGYRTKRGPKGELLLTVVDQEREPLL